MDQSLDGRYVSADLFKEAFEEYRVSKDSRNRYNTPVHNSAAVLASEYLRRLICAPNQHERDTVILLAGTPEGWQYLPLLRSEGGHEHIKQRLRQALENHRNEGRIGQSAYGQSLGQVHGPEDQGMDTSVGGGNESPRDERSRTPENRQVDLLKAGPVGKKVPKPGKDVEESRGRSDDYGL
jgi:hypothetical protein